MNESSMEVRQKDEWSELLLVVMKTSLSVAHELGLPPDATLDCAARHLHFHDFTWLASAMQGASRVHACCERTDNMPAVEVAYIKTLAARVESNRNVLACGPSMYASEVQTHVDAPALAYEKVTAAVRALKGNVQCEFSQSGVSADAAVESASGFAGALVAIMPTEGNAEAYERALAAVLHVRFALDLRIVHGDAGDPGSHPTFDGHMAPDQRPSVPAGWRQRVKDAVHHHRRPNE